MIVNEVPAESTRVSFNLIRFCGDLEYEQLVCDDLAIAEQDKEVCFFFPWEADYGDD